MQKIGDIPNTRADSNGEFTDGVVAGGIPPTILPAEWFNTIQRELINILTAAGITPDSTKFNQLSLAISKLIVDGDFFKIENFLSEIKDAGPAAIATAIANLTLSDADDVAAGDALIAVKQPFAGAVARTVHNKNEEFVSVKDFGAKGDGVTDDTAALQAAFNSGAGEIYIPEGVYIQSLHLGVPSNIVIQGAGEGKTIIKMADGVDQIYHNIVSANAMSLDARLADLDNVDIIIGGYVDNVIISDITIEGNNKNRPKTYIDREQGTAVEMHAVRHVELSNLTVREGIQHCINVRAGTNGFKKGYDYVEKYPSQHVRISNCKTYNQLLDDGITTHDSEYIWIENCEVWQTRNSSDSSKEAVSNGIEIDDGSRYVWVNNCYSNGGFGGYQAKGHNDTRPAHHVWFNHCVAENNHMGWIIAAVASPSKDLSSNYATCHHIYLNNCTIKNCYAFSNATEFAAEGHYIQFYNVRHVYINNLQVIGKTKDMNNMGPIQKVWFRFREYNSYIFMNNTSLVNVDERATEGSPLFTIEENVSDLTIDGLIVDKFTKGQVLYTNATGVNWRIDNVTLQQGSPAYPVFRINGVGGGTMRFGRVKGSGFSIPYQSHSIAADVINYQDYAVISDGNSDVFHDVTIATDATGLGNLVSGVLGIGTKHVAKVGATKYPVGSIFSQVQSGNIADNTASGRMRVAVRAVGSTAPTGVLNISKASLQPANDSVTSVGTAGLRYTQVFAVNGSVSTSDATRKTGLREISVSEISAFAEISRLPSVWQWLQKYQSEGGSARLHSGPTVQACISIMTKHDLDWQQYSCFCYDEYDAVPAEYIIKDAIFDGEGNIITPEERELVHEGTDAGSVYSLRKEELLWWCLRALASQYDSLSSRLDALEQKS